MSKKYVIIGGSAAGPKTAAKLRRLDESAEITIIEKGPDLSMASCGFPYYVGGVFDNRDMLLCTPTGVVRSPGFFMNAKAITARTSTEAVEIRRDAKLVVCRNTVTGESTTVPYDRLMLALGSVPRLPPIEGIDLDGVSTLQSMGDADYLRKVRDEKKISKAIIVGGGLIGIETAEALRLAGIEVTILELADQVLPFLDWDLAKLVENHLRSKGVNVFTGSPVARFLGEKGKLQAVKLANGTEIPCELALVAIGVKPNTTLAKSAGLELGELGGIRVNACMQTNDPDIYAAGDCVEIKSFLTGKPTYSPMGDLANLQGRIAAENMAGGGPVSYAGTTQTGICKIFEYTAGATGLTERAARAAGFDCETVVNASPDKPGFMGGLLLVSKMVVDRQDQRLLGYQCVGTGDASKRVAQAAMAIRGRLTVPDLIDLDLPYAPPFSLAIDHFIASAHIMENKLKGRLHGISVREVREQRCQKSGNPFILDVRGPDEFEVMRLGIGETLIPLGALRKRLGELPPEKDREIICYCKISLRGYEAQLILNAAGYTNVKVMEGGVMAWPYEREK